MQWAVNGVYGINVRPLDRMSSSSLESWYEERLTTLSNKVSLCNIFLTAGRVCWANWFHWPNWCDMNYLCQLGQLVQQGQLVRYVPMNRCQLGQLVPSAELAGYVLMK